MATIADWLASLGLSEYEDGFAENGIDMSVLADLTDQDLKDIGVLLGHRRKMLRAISELGDTTTTTTPPRVVAREPEPNQGLDAERRHVTVMFTDLVDSTALSARMDPEDLREIIAAYQQCVAEIVRRFDGFVAKYMGDGVLVYFGYPQAHEDDVERAVRAGLELIAAVSGLKSRARLQTRVGMATGLVVVGDLIGAGEAQERGIVGETPNLAARLQGIAEPNSVVIAESTRKLLGNLFELRDLGARDLKGLAGPTRAWAVVRKSSIESRFEALHSSRMPLVGRAEEFEVLLRRWQQVKSGQGRVVILTGEPGIGKSRITAALQQRLQGDPHTRLRHFCSPHLQDTALHPLIGQLERAAGFAHDDTAEQKLKKLEAALLQSNPPEDIGFIAALLSITNDVRYPLPELSPQKRKEKTLAALLAQLERLAARQPVLVIYEDAHWIDPTTLELLTLVIERVQHLPVLLLVTARPEFKPPWPVYAHMTHIPLGRIGRDEGTSLIAHVTGGKSLPSEVLQQILARTDGIPLFIEELTKAVVESGVLTDAGDRYTVAGPLPELAIPTSLNASLLARLDRLAPVREVAQIGAALGRQFSHALISAVAPMPQPQLDDALAQLEQAELIYRRGTPPDAVYTFKHALVQDAAYGTLLRARRQQLHGRIAATLEQEFPEIAETQPEQLARHCAEGSLVEKAIGYCLKAGRQAIARGTMTEAVSQLHKGLDILAGLPDGAARQELELDLQIALGHALDTTKGLAAVETGEVYARARRLCDQLDRPPQLGLVLYGQYLFRIVRGELERAEHHAEELRRVREAAGNDTMWKCFGAQIRGNICFYLGKFADVRAFHECAFSLWDPTHRAFAPTAEDPYVGGIIHLFRTLVCLGHLDEARLRRDQALAEAEPLSPFMRAFALRQAWYGDWAIQGAQAAHTILASANEVIAVSDEHGFRDSLAIGNIMRGWCLCGLGQAAEGLPLLLEGLTICRAGGRKLMIPFFLTVLAEAYGMARQPQEALDRLAEAAELADTTHERWMEAEVHRLRGTILLSMDEHAAAEKSYGRALDAARRQGAKFWELRATLDLARLWREQGKCREGRHLLSSIYGWFTEGFDTRDLQQAKALLVDLAR